VNRGRWGYYSCSYEVYLMLKELNKRLFRARKQKAAWERWARKMPHNRPLVEPPLDPCFLRKTTLPSGRCVVVLEGGIEAAYRQARHPVATPEEVRHLLMEEKEVRRRSEAIGPRAPA
jgi:hypothetical protein